MHKQCKHASRRHKRNPGYTGREVSGQMDVQTKRNMRKSGRHRKRSFERGILPFWNETGVSSLVFACAGPFLFYFSLLLLFFFCSFTFCECAPKYNRGVGKLICPRIETNRGVDSGKVNYTKIILSVLLFSYFFYFVFAWEDTESLKRVEYAGLFFVYLKQLRVELRALNLHLILPQLLVSRVF